MCHHWTRDSVNERLQAWVEEPEREPDAVEREEPAVEEREDDRDAVEVPPADD
jgi:hypothetical protein